MKISSKKFLLFSLLSLMLASCQGGTGEDIDVTDTPSPADQISETTEEVSDNTFTLGVLSIDSAVSVNERYSPLVEYLEEATEYDFELVSLSQATQFTQVEQKNIDFTTTNPLSAVQVRRLFNTEFLVTHSRPKTGEQFSGLIVVDASSEIESLEDLKGKSGACVNFQTAAAGCTFQIFHLLERGIDPFTDFASFVENKSQDNIVLGVLNGTLDFGFIRTGQLEKMERKGLIASKEEVRVLEPVDDDFLYEHTTALYPEWPIAALPHVDDGVRDVVQQALLEIPPEHPALQAIGLTSFVTAVDYSKLDDLIMALQLKTWDVQPISE